MENIYTTDLKKAGITRDEFSKRMNQNYFSLSNKLAGRSSWKKEELEKGWDILNKNIKTE